MTLCVHDDGREHPGDTLPCPLVQAVQDAYAERGQRMWWKTWDRADDIHRRSMERAVMADGNCS